MRRIGFHDRGGEIEIKSILEREPSLITFIYGLFVLYSPNLTNPKRFYFIEVYFRCKK